MGGGVLGNLEVLLGDEDKLRLQRVLLQCVRIWGFPQEKGRTNLDLIILTTVVPLLQVAVDLLKDGGGAFLWLNSEWFQLRGGFGRPELQTHMTTDVLKLSYQCRWIGQERTV